jgi:uncharacterized membrane protein HdeD (DUF308 family)
MGADTAFGRHRPDFGAVELRAFFARYWWLMALRGVLAIIFGVIALLVPGVAILSFVLLFAAYMLVDGGFAIAGAVMAARRRERWGLLLLEGLANLAAGVIAVLWPEISVLVFMLLVAAWAIVSGGLLIAAAFRGVQREHGRWWLALSGFVSLLFGVLVVIVPMAGAIALTWWIGAYAIVFGIVLLIFAFKARKVAQA